MVALVADVLASVEGTKYFKVEAGSIEATPAWRMWSDEVVAMGRATQNGRGTSSQPGLAARVQLATEAARALRTEISRCPPIAREILACREVLMGLSYALELDDDTCLSEVCEVVIMCAQECGTRAGDALVSCPKLLNGLCSRAMRTEDPSVIDALTAVSHQNDKMLWVVTTIIKVMRVEKRCHFLLSQRVFRALKLVSGQRSMDRARNTLLQVTSRLSKSALSLDSRQRMCDVDESYIQKALGAGALRQDQPRGVLVDASKHSMTVSPRLTSTQRMRDDIIIEPSAPSVSSTKDFSAVKRSDFGRSGGAQPTSLFSSWSASTPLYSTLNASSRDMVVLNQFGLMPEEQASSQSSSSSSLSLPSTTGTETTFRSRSSHVGERRPLRCEHLVFDVTDGAKNCCLPEARVLPERPWEPQDGDQTKHYDKREKLFSDQLTVPPDSLLYASRFHNARTPSAPPRLSEPSTTLSLMPTMMQSSIGSPVGRAFLSARALSPPRILEPLPYVEPAASGAPGSVCDVDTSLLSYFNRCQTHDLTVAKTQRPSSPSEMRRSAHLEVHGDISPRVDHRRFHKMADEFAFGRIGVGARMIRGDTPPRLSPMRQCQRDPSPPATRSIVGASTIQFANIGTRPTSPYQSMYRSYTSAPGPSSLPVQGNVVMCDVDETFMRPAFTAFMAGDVQGGGDWEGRASYKDWVCAPEDADSEDDWC